MAKNVKPDYEITAEELATLSDGQLQKVAENAIYTAALMGARLYDDWCTRVYRECDARKKGIYQKAYNAVVRAEGHSSMATEVKEDQA